jgi:hypothetical protein
MNERLAQLDEALKKLAAGELDKESLKTSVNLAREIYEQWIIVQHEFKDEDIENPILESFKEIRSPIKNTFKQKEDPLELKEEAVNFEETIETDEAIISENQTTLIEIIEEIQEDQTINERISKGLTKESLAQKHAKKAIDNIEKSIGLNQKFSFIKTLFNADNEAYSDAVNKLNSCASFLEADDFIHNELMEKYDWDENTVQVIKFIELVERRYLSH